MPSVSRPVWYAALGAATATFVITAALRPFGAAVRTPSLARDLTLAAVLLVAQAATLGVFWKIATAGRVPQSEVTALHEDLAALSRHLDHIDENTEILAARTARLAAAMEIRKAIPQEPAIDPESTAEVVAFPSGPRRIR